VRGHSTLLSVTDSSMGSARHNLSSAATFDDYELQNPFASGQFRYVAKGRYTNGPRVRSSRVKTANTMSRCKTSAGASFQSEMASIASLKLTSPCPPCDTVDQELCFSIAAPAAAVAAYQQFLCFDLSRFLITLPLFCSATSPVYANGSRLGLCMKTHSSKKT
jgi:hypothetical protein